MNIIETDNITKIYSSLSKSKSVTALRDFSLSVESGLVYGLLGPNGAGKTTLVKILLGITFPTLGNAKLFGEDISNYKLRRKVGYLPENHRFPNYLTGGEVLSYFAKLSCYDSPNLERRIDELLELVKMTRWKKTKVKNYSKGMMQRIGLAQSMINDPEIIFLDEPTDGVDPIGRKEIRDILLDMKNQGKTIFLNSHLLSEVELITDRVAILNEGKLIREGTVEDITTQKEEFKISADQLSLSIFSEEETSKFKVRKIDENKINVRVENLEELNMFIDLLRNRSVKIRSVEPQKSTLEEMFISLIHESENKKS